MEYYNYKPNKYHEYFFELLEFLRDTYKFKVVSPNDNMVQGYYYESTTDKVEKMYKMHISDDGTLGFDYYNQCVEFDYITFHLRDIKNMFEDRKDAIKMLQCCMKYFSAAAKV